MSGGTDPGAGDKPVTNYYAHLYRDFDLPPLVRARPAAWLILHGNSDGNFRGESPEEQRYMANHWPEPVAPHVELIPVSDELAAVLRADWSQPVQIKIVDGEMICRRAEEATSDG